MKHNKEEASFQKFFSKKKCQSKTVSEIRANFYWDKLNSINSIKLRNVMDFGAGFGFFVKKIAETNQDSLIYAIDNSIIMIDHIISLCNTFKNVVVEKWVTPPAFFKHPRFDLIVANSVIQYMGDECLRSWIRWWIQALSDCGHLVLSDIMINNSNKMSNCLQMLKWGRKNRCTASVLYEFLIMILNGYYFNKEYYRDKDKLLAMIAEEGDVFCRVEKNFDILTTRYTIVIRNNL